LVDQIAPFARFSRWKASIGIAALEGMRSSLRMALPLAVSLVLASLMVTAYLDPHVSHTLRDWMLIGAVQLLVTVPITLLLVRWTFTAPLTRMAAWLRTLRAAEHPTVAAKPATGILTELQHEVTHLARDLGTARASAAREARLRESNASIWTAERLRVSV